MVGGELRCESRRRNGSRWMKWNATTSRTLAHTFNNRSAAARLLGVTRQALLRKMKRHGISNG